MDARDALQHTHLFRGADAADLEAVAAIAEPKAYAAGEHIFDQGHPADALLQILIGSVEIRTTQKDVALVTLASGQTVGEVAFFERGPRNASASTREATRVLRLPFDALERLLAARPGLALIVYRNAATFFAHHLAQMSAERDRPYF